MQSETMEILIAVSICCDVVLFFLIVWLFFKVKGLGPERLERLINELRESQALVDRLQAIIEEKARLAKALENNLRSYHSSKNPVNIKGKNNIKEQVLLLYDKGVDIAEIAESTGLTTGEVELIISIKSVSV